MAIGKEFEQLLRELEEGSEEAVWELVQRFSPYLYRVVRRRLHPSLRRRYESSDFAQMAWASFLLSDRPLSDFSDEKAMRGYLAGIAANKVLMGARATFKSQKRDQSREVPIDSADIASPIMDGEPTPSHVAAFRDSWNTYLSSKPAHYQRIVQMRMEGKTYQFIADSLELNERTVRRVLDSLCAEVAA